MKMFAAILLAFLAIGTSFADPVTVNIESNKNNPVFQAVVYFEPTQLTEFPEPEKISVMDQIESQFVPHILPVQKGSLVTFPNSDSIKHHVYSFSDAKNFELQLYKGLKAAPIPFAAKGEVELGCNVHDWMLGYIFVVETPYFAKTDQNGNATIDVPPGEYSVKIWHPRIQDDNAVLSKKVMLPIQDPVKFSLTVDLLSDLNAFEANQDEFSDYD